MITTIMICLIKAVADLDSIAQLNLYRAIVVVSIENENALFSTVNQQLQNVSHPVILRLFADVFVNRLCDRQLLQPSSQKHSKTSSFLRHLNSPSLWFYLSL